MTWRTEQGDREAVAHFLRTRNQDGLDALGFAAGLTGVPADEWEAMMYEELAKQDHETHLWWNGPCNCHGSLN